MVIYREKLLSTLLVTDYRILSYAYHWLNTTHSIIWTVTIYLPINIEISTLNCIKPFRSFPSLRKVISSFQQRIICVQILSILVFMPHCITNQFHDKCTSMIYLRSNISRQRFALASACNLDENLTFIRLFPQSIM